MRKLNLFVLVLWIVLMVVSGCQPVVPSSEEPGANELTPIQLGVGFIPNVQFATYYVAIEKGFYKEEGLDVSLAHGFENDYLKLVGIGETQFMIGSGDQVVLGRAQGLPVRYVMNWYTQYPVVIFAKTEAQITEPADLKGKTIGIPGPFGASYVALRGILEAASLSESDIKLESIGFTQAAALSEDKVDAAVDYGVNGPVVLGLAGIETTQIKLDQYLRIPANGLVTNQTLIDTQPELVQKMVRASLKGAKYTVEHPDEAFQIALKFVPEAGGDNEKANRAVFDAVLNYWKPVEGRKLGETSADEWQAAADLMLRIGLVDTAVTVEELYTNEFIE